MANEKICKDVSLYLDAKNNLYWLFRSDTTEKGFGILALPAVKFDAATTDYKTLMQAVLKLMNDCKIVNYEDASREIDARFKKETGWASPGSLQRALSAWIGIEINPNTDNITISIYETKSKKRGLGKANYVYPVGSSLDELGSALEKIIAEAKEDAQK